MIEHPDVIPIAVLTAISLFFVKELLEAVRRYSSNARKLHAVRKFIAAECERNYFAIERLRAQISDASSALENDAGVSIERRLSGNSLLVIRRDENGFSSSPVPRIHTIMLEKYLFDAATLNANLFESMEKSLDALVEVSHVRDSLIELVAEDPQHLSGFADYGADVIENAIEPLRNLYFKCTGEPLTQGRVR